MFAAFAAEVSEDVCHGNDASDFAADGKVFARHGMTGAAYDPNMVKSRSKVVFDFLKRVLWRNLKMIN